MTRQSVRRMVLTVLAVFWLTPSPEGHAVVEILA